MLVGQREEAPLPRRTLQGVRPAILEARVRSHHDVLHRARHQDVTRAGQRLDARGNVHGHPGHRAPFETSSSPDSISDHPVAGMIQVPDPGPTWPARMPSSRAMGGAGSCDRSNARMRSIPGKRPEPGGRHVPPDRFVDGHTGGSRWLPVPHRAHSITWFARRRSAGGMVSPRALALFRLTTKCKRSASSTGNSLGFVPLSTRAT